MNLQSRSPFDRAAATVAVVAMLAAGCSSPQHDDKSPQSVGSCPEKIADLIDPTKTAAEETSVTVDKTKSFVGSSAAQASLEAQVRAAVTKSVDQSAALRVSVFTGSVATVQVVAICPAMAAKYNNPAARERRMNYLRAVAAEQIWIAVRDTKPGPGGKGSSIVGGWAELTAAAPLAGRRHAVMLSDGRGPQDDIDVDLSGFATVGMFAVGRVATQSSDTEATARLVRRWQKWLTGHGATESGLTVTSGEFR